MSSVTRNRWNELFRTALRLEIGLFNSVLPYLHGDQEFGNIYELGAYLQRQFPRLAIGHLDILFEVLRHFGEASSTRLENALTGLDIQNVRNLSVSLMDRIFATHQDPTPTDSMAVILQNAFLVYSALARGGEDLSDLDQNRAEAYVHMFENGGCSKEHQTRLWNTLENETGETGRVALHISLSNIPNLMSRVSTTAVRGGSQSRLPN